MLEPGEDDTQRVAGGRVLLALIVGQIGLHSAMAGLRMVMPLQLLREGFSPWALGLLLALFAAAPVALALPSGRLADRHGYHRPVHLAAVTAVVAVAIAFAACWTSGWLHFVLLCAAAMLSGTAANLGILTIQRYAGLMARTATERMRVFSWIGIAPSFANVVGPVTAGLMIDATGFAGADLVLAALPLATLVSARFVPHVSPRGTAALAPRPARELMDAPGMKPLMMVNWLMSMCWEVHSFAVPVIGHAWGFSASTIGLILGTFTLSVTAVRGLLPLLAHRIDEIRLLQLSMLGTAAICALYPLARSPALMGTCATLLGVTLGVVQPVVMTTMHHLTPADRHGEALAVRSMTLNASSSVMPLLFGALGSTVGAAVLFWGVGGAVGAGSWLARRLATTVNAAIKT